MLTGMAEGPIPGMQVLRWGDTLGWKFSPKKMEVELVHLFCFQGAFGWREGFARVCSWCHRQRSQGGLTSPFDQFMLAPLVARRENTILYLSWIRFGKSINLFCSVPSLVMIGISPINLVTREKTRRPPSASSAASLARAGPPLAWPSPASSRRSSCPPSSTRW